MGLGTVRVEGEVLTVDRIWMERGAIWIEASTRRVRHKHRFKDAVPVHVDVFAEDCTHIRCTTTTLNTHKVNPGDPWVLEIDFRQASLAKSACTWTCGAA